MTVTLGKKPTACVPCHERKVRCDSTAVGIPCTRCMKKDRVESCTLLERGGKNSNKRRRTVTDSEAVLSPRQREEDLAGDQQSRSPSNQPPDHNHANTTPRPLTPATSVGPQRHNSSSHRDVAEGLLELSHVESNKVASQEQQTGIHIPAAAAPIQYLISEDDAHLETLCRMADDGPVTASPVPLSNSEHGHQVIEYYGELNSVTVLSEVLGQSQRRLVRIDLPGPAAVGALEREFSRLEEADIAYLRGKGVQDFPPDSTCRALLLLFFKHVYPYTPILNRQQLLEDYDRRSCSSFLLWSIFAGAVSYASPELLLEAGYTEYSAAQKVFFSNARLLYDFGCEKSQLNILQGSILLSSFQFSFAPDKDFRFWFHNAVRIALQMGFNRRDVWKQLDLSTYRLLRRIWWVLYSRDVWFSIVGFENARRIQDDTMDMSLLEAADWLAEVVISPQYKAVIPDITPLQQNFLIEHCRLTLLGAQFLNLLSPNCPTPTLQEGQRFSGSLAAWRTSFSEELLPDRVSQWTDSNCWVLFLWAMGFRLECSFYRTLRQRTKVVDEESAIWATTRLRQCVFEFDTVLKRAVVNDVAQYCPPSLIICTSHLLALHLEMALDCTASESQRIAAKMQIHTGLAYLRDVGDRWLNAKWTYRVFDSVTRRLGIAVGDDGLLNNSKRWGAGDAGAGMWQDVPINGSVMEAPMDLGPCQGDISLGLPDRWIESLLTENLMSGLDDGLFNLLVP